MDKLLDPATDWLADAALTPEERHIWDRMRADLLAAREKIRDLEARLRLLERQPQPEEIQTILTRPEFNREVARMLAFDERYGGTSSVLYFDFEGVEKITAQHGKAIANATLRSISDVLMKCVRSSDIVGRLAADEFGVLLTRCDNAHAWKKGEQLAARLYESLAEVHGCKLSVGISYGAYTFHENEDVGRGLKEAAQLFTRARSGL